jgi:hypothetical protein
MYTAFMLISLFYIVKNSPVKVMIFFGISLSFKLQAIFMLPFIIFVFVYKKWSFTRLLYLFAGLLDVSIPAWLFGWPIYKWFTNYTAGTYIGGALFLNAPTVFTWGDIPGTIPVLFILCVLLCLGFLIINRKSEISNSTLLLLFLFCNFVIPFFLPNMHERYFYAGEIAVLLYVLLNPKRFWISLLVFLPAIFTYSNFLYGTSYFTLQQLSLVVLCGSVIITKWLIESIISDQHNYFEAAGF